MIKFTQLLEGGNAVKADRIPAGKAMEIYNEVSGMVKLHYPGTKMEVLGSVGKKNDPDTNGDIDIAIQISSKAELLDIIEDVFDGCEINKNTGGNIVSIGYPYMHNGRRMVAQVDFMIEEDLEWAQFWYSSPDFRNNESQFKGAVKNMYFSILVSCIPVEERPEVDANGNLLAKWKYTISSLGLSKQFLDYRGRNGILKNPKKIKELEKFISKNSKDIYSFLFNDSVDLKVFNSVESLFKAAHSNAFRYPDILQLVDTRFEAEVLAPLGKTLEEFRELLN